MDIGFIGAGKVGCSLGKYFVLGGLSVKGYYSRNIVSAEEAAEFTETKAYSSLQRLMADCDAVFITVPDGSIKAVFEQLETMDINGKQLCHCSGAMSAEEAFPDIEKYGAFGCSIHPLFPVSSRFEAYKELGRAFFCLEGEKEHISEWSSIFSALGNPVRIISADIKSKYHAACAISSNLVCALAETSVSLLKECGFTENEALAALRPLALSNMERIFSVGAVNALTGPVERNDSVTVEKHLKCITDAAENELYRAVTRKLTEMAEKRHPEADYTNMKKIIE